MQCNFKQTKVYHYDNGYLLHNWLPTYTYVHMHVAIVSYHAENNEQLIV